MRTLAKVTAATFAASVMFTGVTLAADLDPLPTQHPKCHGIHALFHWHTCKHYTHGHGK